MRTVILLNPTMQLAAVIAIASALTGCGPQTKIKAKHAKVLAKVRTVAVLPFQDAPGLDAKDSGKVVVSAIMAQLYDLPGMQVVERERLAVILKEQDLRGSVGSSKASAIGKLAGADLVIFGDIQQYQAPQDSSFLRVSVVEGGETKRMHRVGLFVRAVSVATGRVIYAAGGQGEDKIGYMKAARTAAAEALRDLRAFYIQTRKE